MNELPEQYNYKDLLTVPNLLSLSRIPIAAVMMILAKYTLVFIVLLVLAAITDYLDGALARRTRITRIGIVLDPLCDKIFFVSLFIFVAIYAKLHIYQLLLLVIREVYLLIVISIFIWHSKRKTLRSKMKARWLGKMTTVTQFLALPLIYLNLVNLDYVILIVAIVSFMAMIDYSFFIKKELKKEIKNSNHKLS